MAGFQKQSDIEWSQEPRYPLSWCTSHHQIGLLPLCWSPHLQWHSRHKPLNISLIFYIYLGKGWQFQQIIMYLYLWAHVLLGSLYIFPLKIFVARDQLHGQPEVDQLEFPRHQEKVTWLDVGMNDVDMVNVSRHHIISNERIWPPSPHCQ